MANYDSLYTGKEVDNSVASHELVTENTYDSNGRVITSKIKGDLVNNTAVPKATLAEEYVVGKGIDVALAAKLNKNFSLLDLQTNDIGANDLVAIQNAAETYPKKVLVSTLKEYIRTKLIEELDNVTLTSEEDDDILHRESDIWVDTAIKRLKFAVQELEDEPLAEGHLRYNNGVLEVGLGSGVIGQICEEMYLKIKAGEDILDGQPCYGFGSTGENPIGYLASRANYERMIGLATQVINEPSIGHITTFGLVNGVQSNGANYGETWIAGDSLYLTDVAGTLTNVKPTSGMLVKMGIVLRAHASDGKILVNIKYENLDLQRKPIVANYVLEVANWVVNEYELAIADLTTSDLVEVSFPTLATPFLTKQNRDNLANFDIYNIELNDGSLTLTSDTTPDVDLTILVTIWEG
jgi:hypothetical protein